MQLLGITICSQTRIMSCGKCGERDSLLQMTRRLSLWRDFSESHLSPEHIYKAQKMSGFRKLQTTVRVYIAFSLFTSLPRTSLSLHQGRDMTSLLQAIRTGEEWRLASPGCIRSLRPILKASMSAASLNLAGWLSLSPRGSGWAW